MSKREERQEWVFELTIPLMEEYGEYYKKLKPKSKIHPLKANGKIVNLAPYPLSLNITNNMEHPQRNAVKQKWSDFICWWVDKLGYANLGLNGIEMFVEFHFGDFRDRDIGDNYNLKFINDGFVKSGFIVDDNCKIIQKVQYVYKGVCKEFPRTVIRFVKLDDDEIIKDERKNKVSKKSKEE